MKELHWDGGGHCSFSEEMVLEERWWNSSPMASYSVIWSGGVD